MRNLIFIPVVSLFFTLLLSACSESFDKSLSELRHGELVIQPKFGAEICPKPPDKPASVSVSKIKDVKGVDFIDPNKDFKDNGTDIVNAHFFQTKETLFNFMELVYPNIDNALGEYIKNKRLENGAVFLLFKGGNVLRLIANNAFNLMPPELANLLEEQYSEFFQRSDADFSVYVDEQKLNGQDYAKIFDEVTELVYNQLVKIRTSFIDDPQKYFDFMRFRPDFAGKTLSKYLANIRTIAKNSDKWKDHDFRQLQLLDYQAAPGAKCFYTGGYDKRFEGKNNPKDPNVPSLVTTRLSNEPSWIVLTDNRNLQGNWGSDDSKIVKFRLVRAKINFITHVVSPDGEFRTKATAGEAIDVSLPERTDARLRGFLDNLDKTVSEYTLTSGNGSRTLNFKAYSLLNLAEDLQFIVFDSFMRPWEHPKYFKRINRLFFLMILEMIEKYGVGSTRAQEYIADIEEKIINPLKEVYPHGPKSKELGEDLLSNAESLETTWKEMEIGNEFWLALAEFVNERLINSPLDGDQEGFVDGTKNPDGTLKKPDPFMKTVEDNLEIMRQISVMDFKKIDIKSVYDADVNDIH